MRVAIVHDYLTQFGGAERVVLAMAKAFPEAPVYTSMYEPDHTYPEFRSLDVRTTILDRWPLTAMHRMAFPLLASVFSRLVIDADVVLCSSSGWAHGVQTSGHKIVYCYTPARWLYQTDRYTGERSWGRLMAPALRPLRTWDAKAAASATRYLTSSTTVQTRIKEAYELEATVLHPGVGLDPSGNVEALLRVDPGFFLCVSRLLHYKNVGAVVASFAAMPDRQLIVVGDGPLGSRLRRAAGQNVTFVPTASDAELRWLYANCVSVVSASYEDFGLTPLEGLMFAKPAVTLRWGGFLDTVLEDETGIFFDAPEPAQIAEAIRRAAEHTWEEAALLAQAERFTEAAFIAQLRKVVADTAEDSRAT